MSRTHTCNVSHPHSEAHPLAHNTPLPCTHSSTRACREHVDNTSITFSKISILLLNSPCNMPTKLTFEKCREIRSLGPSSHGLANVMGVHPMRCVTRVMCVPHQLCTHARVMSVGPMIYVLISLIRFCCMAHECSLALHDSWLCLETWLMSLWHEWMCILWRFIVRRGIMYMNIFVKIDKWIDWDRAIPRLQRTATHYNTLQHIVWDGAIPRLQHKIDHMGQ